MSWLASSRWGASDGAEATNTARRAAPDAAQVSLGGLPDDGMALMVAPGSAWASRRRRERAGYASSRIQSATCSPIMMEVRLMFARGMAGMTDASTTRRFGMVRTWQYWSTTVIGSLAGPIWAVP